MKPGLSWSFPCNMGLVSELLSLFSQCPAAENSYDSWGCEHVVSAHTQLCAGASVVMSVLCPSQCCEMQGSILVCWWGRDVDMPQPWDPRSHLQSFFPERNCMELGRRQRGQYAKVYQVSASVEQKLPHLLYHLMLTAQKVSFISFMS